MGITFLGVQTEVYGLERLEVLRGPASELFGKGDVGGVVNRVSKVPSADAESEIGVQIGRYDRKQVMADLGGTPDADSPWSWRVVALGLDTGTQDEYPNGERMMQKRQYLAPSLKWQASPETALVLQAEVLRDDGSDDVQFVTDANGQPTNLKGKAIRTTAASRPAPARSAGNSPTAPTTAGSCSRRGARFLD